MGGGADRRCSDRLPCRERRTSDVGGQLPLPHLRVRFFMAGHHRDDRGPDRARRVQDQAGAAKCPNHRGAACPIRHGRQRPGVRGSGRRALRHSCPGPHGAAGGHRPGALHSRKRTRQRRTHRGVLYAGATGIRKYIISAPGVWQRERARHRIRRPQICRVVHGGWHPPRPRRQRPRRVQQNHGHMGTGVGADSGAAGGGDLSLRVRAGAGPGQGAARSDGRAFDDGP